MLFLLMSSLAAWATPPLRGVPVPPVAASSESVLIDVGAVPFLSLFTVHGTVVVPVARSPLAAEVATEVGFLFAGMEGALWARTGADHHKGFHGAARLGVRSGIGIDGGGALLPSQGVDEPDMPIYVGLSAHGQVAYGWGERNGGLSLTVGAEDTLFVSAPSQYVAFPDVQLRVDGSFSDRTGMYVGIGVPNLLSTGVVVRL